jgi:hypothetical protein
MAPLTSKPSLSVCTTVELLSTSPTRLIGFPFSVKGAMPALLLNVMPT